MQLSILQKKNMRINSSREDIENIYLFILGHHAPYLHLHLVPTYLWTPREFWGLKVDEWLDTPKADVHVIEKFCIRLLETFKLPAND